MSKASLTRGDLAPYKARRITQADWDDNTVVYIQSLTEYEMAAVYDPVRSGRSPNTVMIAKCVVDENGLRVFDDAPETLGFIESLDSAVTRRLAKLIDEHLEGPRLDVAGPKVEDSAKN